VLPALVRCAPRLGVFAGLDCSDFWVCFLLAFFEVSGVFFGRKMGLIGSISGAFIAMFVLGVDPEGFGVHLVPLPVIARKAPWDNGVWGRPGRGPGVWTCAKTCGRGP
jgi:hypothetical protein